MGACNFLFAAISYTVFSYLFALREVKEGICMLDSSLLDATLCATVQYPYIITDILV